MHQQQEHMDQVLIDRPVGGSLEKCAQLRRTGHLKSSSYKVLYRSYEPLIKLSLFFTVPPGCSGSL
jgi:hypothetical protein